MTAHKDKLTSAMCPLLLNCFQHYYKTLYQHRLETCFSPGSPTGTAKLRLKVSIFVTGCFTRYQNPSLIPGEGSIWYQSIFVKKTILNVERGLHTRTSQVTSDAIFLHEIRARAVVEIRTRDLLPRANLP
jgi:hypothetical protein